MDNDITRKTHLPDSNTQPLPITLESLALAAGGKPREWFAMWKPSSFVRYVTPKDFVLMGNSHLTRGGLTVLGGFAGVGKSRASLALAIAGARGIPWMDLPIHSRFRTLIIQCENGPFRLKTELTEALDDDELDDWIRITPPPSYGLAFREPGFRDALQRALAEFRPGLIVIDPWNRTADGDKQTDYRSALDSVFECLPEDINEKPAVLVVHHMRKKGSDFTRKQGRDLLHELAGSYQIGSSARCVFVLEPSTNDPEDETVVLTCCKNNDGREGRPTAWKRRNGLFEAVPGFDMEAFLSGDGSEKSRRVSFGAISEALRGMHGETKTQVVMRLVNASVCSRTTGYSVMRDYPDHIVEDSQGRFYWREDA